MAVSPKSTAAGVCQFAQYKRRTGIPLAGGRLGSYLVNLKQIFKFLFFGVSRAVGQARRMFVVVLPKSTAAGVYDFAQYKRSTGIPGGGSY